MEDDDKLLEEYAHRDTDYYALLGAHITPTSSDKDIKAAYRRAALLHHPDKHPDDPNAPARFHDLQIALTLLTHPTYRAKYDNARAAREARRAQAEQYDARRKEMVSDLERREAASRKESNETSVAEVEATRLAEDGRRRRHELSERWRQQAKDTASGHLESSALREDGHHANSLVSRAVKVRWDAKAHTVDSDTLERRFSQFGRIESITMRGERKVRLEGQKKRRNLFTAMLLFDSLDSARQAVDSVTQLSQVSDDWAGYFIEWAEGKEPEQVAREPKSERLSPAELVRFKAFESSVLSRLKMAQDLKMKKMAVP
jgi:DnaJ homolog subfamily C member 17